MNEMEQLKQRIAALEATLAQARKAEGDDDDEDEGKETLAAEIASLERQLCADDEDEKKEDEKEAASKKAEEKKEDEAKEEDDKGEKTASETEPGIEDEITNDRHREVERLQHGTELTTGTSMLDVSPTSSEYKARLKLASARLDKVADYLEKHGRRELAFRIDKIADAIDARIKGGK